MSLGQFFKNEIKAKGYRLGYVASKCGIDQSTLSRYLTGRAPISKPMQTLLCYVLDIDTDILQGGSYETV